ncbi:MFS transporter [Lacticaseibacillus manihotivorans]|uniref:Transport protein n=1 Tax=Lacticaseibacillus manihotivorans DSM 13343 = JCM 12514 TaxID=1423769 RepID=A0A0R1RFS7_9LACO|nr:transport protein [Lacticaseibacillus manihotivorans DSM 13343 = JCM 12514]
MLNQSVSWRQKGAILACGLLSFVGILVETSMNVTFPTLMQDFHVSLATVQWLTTAYLLVVTIVMSTTAYVLERFPPRKLFGLAVSLCLLGGLGCAFAPSFLWLLIGRLMQAVATGISTPLMFQLIFATIPRQKLGLYTGFASVIVSLAPALGPTYGGILTSWWSWRGIFWGIMPLLVIIAVLGLWAIHGQAQGIHAQRFDFIGVALLALVFTSIVLGFDAAGVHGWLSVRFGVWVLVVIALIALLVEYAKHSTRQIFDYSILKQSLLTKRLVNYFGLQFINIGLAFTLPLLAQNGLGAGAFAAGLMLLPGALIGAVVAPIAGRMYDQHGANGVLLFSAGTAIVAMLGFIVWHQSLTVFTIAGLFIILRLAFNSGFGVALSDASKQVSGPQKADQNALFSMMQQYAGALGTSVMAAVIANLQRDNAPKLATINGAGFDFIVLLGVAGLILLATIKAMKQE